MGTQKEEEMIRLNKYLSDAGYCSRREADRLIEEGKVIVDGMKAVMGMKVTADQEIVIGGRSVIREEKRILIAFNKPKGIVCTTSKEEPDNIIDYLNLPKRVYPVGRLDKDSEGLILLTNKGDIVDRILRGSNCHEKEYLVRVNKRITADFLNGMRNGVPVLNTVTRPCTVEKIDNYKIKIILTQGLNRQIRRMCEYFDYRVVDLKRTRIMNITLGNLRTGAYRNITEEEKRELFLRTGMEEVSGKGNGING